MFIFCVYSLCIICVKSVINITCMLSHFICVQFFATPWTVARQSPLSTGCSRQEYWSGLPGPSPGDLPDPEIEPSSLTSSALAGRFFNTSATREAPINNTAKAIWQCVGWEPRLTLLSLGTNRIYKYVPRTFVCRGLADCTSLCIPSALFTIAWTFRRAEPNDIYISQCSLSC